MRKNTYLLLHNYKTYGTFLNLALKKLSLEEQIQKNVTIRTYGVVQNEIYLDYLLDLNLERKIDVETRLLLQMALFEHLYLDSVPDYALISEYTNLCKIVKRDSVKFVSYFLNNKLCDINHVELNFKNEAKNLSIKYSINQWIVKKLIKQYPDDYLDIISDIQNKKSLYVRELQNFENNDFEKYLFEDLYTYQGNVLKTEEFRLNKIKIQDFGSFLVTKYVDPTDTDIILDLCAAPGNKTLHLASIAKTVIANELHKSRFDLLNRNISESNALNINTINCDATDFISLDKLINGVLFDKILIDAPCSGVGVIKSKPEIKNRLTIKDVDDITSTQKEILKTAVEFLRPGGELIYSTCSIFKEENEDIMNWFCQEYGYKEKENVQLKQLCKSDAKIGVLLKPNIHNSDGFYMCKLIKD